MSATNKNCSFVAKMMDPNTSNFTEYHAMQSAADVNNNFSIFNDDPSLTLTGKVFDTKVQETLHGSGETVLRTNVRYTGYNRTQMDQYLQLLVDSGQAATYDGTDTVPTGEWAGYNDQNANVATGQAVSIFAAMQAWVGTAEYFALSSTTERNNALAPIGSTGGAGVGQDGMLCNNTDAYVQLGTGTATADRAYALALISDKDQSSQTFTEQYSGNINHMIARAEPGNTYKVSFWMKGTSAYVQPAGGSVGHNSSYVHGADENGNHVANWKDEHLSGTDMFGPDGSDYSIATPGQAEVWIFGCDSSYSAFNTGTGNNVYKTITEADNGGHFTLTTEEGIRMRLNGWTDPGSSYNTGTEQTQGTAIVKNTWRYFEYTVTFSKDHHANLEYISMRLDQDKNGDAAFINVLGGIQYYYYPGVEIANWCVEPMNVSFIGNNGQRASETNITFGGQNADLTFD